MAADFHNEGRFSGISDIYHDSRPRFPDDALDVLLRYMGKGAELAVDLGCGTGLSTSAIATISDRVFGIEPNDDMLERARDSLAKVTNVTLAKGVAERIPLDNGCADLVLCAQAFHWMRPEKAIPEICRVLRVDGVFAAVDYDWPGVFEWRSENAYEAMIACSEKILEAHHELVGATHKWSKGEHLKNMKAFGNFRYVREIVISSEEPCNGERFCRMALSQSGVQAVLQSQYSHELDKSIEKMFLTAQTAANQGAATMRIPYRIRLGVR